MSWKGKVRSVHATLTYGGLLEGGPGFAHRFMAADDTFGRTVERMWGPRPTVVLNYRDYATREDRIPRWTYYAWLDWPDSNWVGDWDDPDGHELAVVWFSDRDPAGAEHDLDELVTDELWNLHAKEYRL